MERKFLLQLKEEAQPTIKFVDDNEYKIWGFHFFNQERRMKEIDAEFAGLIGKVRQIIKHRLRDFAIFDEATPLFSPWWKNMT